MISENRKTVLVAMSGGVDSSVAAALLQEQGYAVIGMTMRLTDEDDGGTSLPDRPCCSVEMASRARRVCDRLGVPHYVTDFREIFQKQVKDDFVRQYMNGMTPNPCVRCNTYIKWQPLVRKKHVLGADFIATGHYARSVFNDESGTFELRQGMDRGKDQSYFLWGLSGEQLSYTKFPLGEMTKSEVRRRARELNLPTADVPESMEICFIPNNNYRDYVDRRVREAGIAGSGGIIRDAAGKILGHHKGYQHFTIGQRKGLGIALGTPAYVTDIIPAENAVVIGQNDDLLSDYLEAESLNWINGAPVTGDGSLMVKIRYRDPGTEAEIEPCGDTRVRVYFKKSVRAVTPGQSVVFYRGDTVAGGGVISRKTR